MDKSMANEERLVGQVSGRLQFFRFADAPMIKRVGIVLLDGALPHRSWALGANAGR